MISVNVRVQGEEVLFRLEDLPKKVQLKVEEKFSTLITALKDKVLDKVGQKLGKPYPEMFVSGTQKVGESLLVGFVEFQPASKWYEIRVGSKGVLANRETGFFSKTDVFHPPMKPVSIQTPFDQAYRDYLPTIIEGLEDAVVEAIYE